MKESESPMSHSARPPSREFMGKCAAAAALVAAMLVVLVTARASPAAGEPERPATAPSTRPAGNDARPGEIAARRIVFVCDASGSTKPKLPTLRRELHKVVRDLRQSQQFNLIFFRDNEALALNQNAVVRRRRRQAGRRSIYR